MIIIGRRPSCTHTRTPAARPASRRADSRLGECECRSCSDRIEQSSSSSSLARSLARSLRAWRRPRPRPAVVARGRCSRGSRSESGNVLLSCTPRRPRRDRGPREPVVSRYRSSDASRAPRAARIVLLSTRFFSPPTRPFRSAEKLGTPRRAVPCRATPPPPRAPWEIRVGDPVSGQCRASERCQ